MIKDGESRISQDAHGPFEDGPAVHGEVVQALFEGRGRGRNPTAAGRPAEQVAPRAVGAKLIGDQSLIFLSRPEQDRPGTVAEKREALLVARIDHPAIAVSADHQGALAVPRGHELGRR